MLGVQYQADVEKMAEFLVRQLTRQHIEEVGGMADIAPGGYGWLTFANAVPGGHDGREPGNQAGGLAQAGLAVAGRYIRVVAGQHGGDRLEDVHRM